MFPAWRARHCWQTDAPDGGPEIKSIPEEQMMMLSLQIGRDSSSNHEVITASVMFYLTTTDMHI